MMMAIKDGQLLLKKVDSTQYTVIKSWGMMKWDKSNQMLVGSVSRDLLNRLAQLLSPLALSETVENERQRLNKMAEAIDVQRMDPTPQALIPPPVKVKPYQHQIRGYNMALITLGLVAPPVQKEEV